MYWLDVLKLAFAIFDEFLEKQTNNKNILHFFVENTARRIFVLSPFVRHLRKCAAKRYRKIVQRDTEK
jgi:hypothetical protein